MAARKRAAGQQLESMFEEGEKVADGSAAAAIEDEVAAAERQYTAELQAELRAARAEAAEAEAAADEAAAAAPYEVRGNVLHITSCALESGSFHCQKTSSIMPRGPLLPCLLER